MSKIVKQDTNGVKPLLAVGELGYDNYPSGGDKGRVYVGDGTVNIALAKKSEVDVKVVANVDITAGTATKVTYDAKGLVTSGTNPTTLSGYGITDADTSAQVTTKINNAVAALVDASPTTLDTLNELAAALGDDPNFATTTSTALGNRVVKNADIVAGTGTKITYDAKGLVTSSTTPTTLAGYSIGDAYTKAEADALHDSLAVASAGQSVSYFLDNVTTPGGNYALTNSPDGDPETTIAKIAVAANTPYFMERYISDPIGDTAIDGGLWVFRTYARVSSDVGTSEIVSRINKRTIKSGTVTITGTGTSRTITSSDPIFVFEDANSSILNATLIETPTETFWISAFTSATRVTAITDNSGYVNETSVSIHMYYKLFEATTGDINGNTAKLYETKSIQPSFNIVPTDSILIAYFAITTSTNKTLTLYKGGIVNYSHIVTPIVYRHNSLKGLNEGEFQHLTTAQLAKINAISGTNTGDQTITLTGDVTGSGTGSFATALSNTGVSVGTYKSVTVDAQGRVTAGTNPTTISGYGITDAYTKAELNAGQLDNRYYTETEIDTLYSTAVKLTGDQTVAGIKTFSSNIVGSITGNSATATKLATARTINGVAFDGSANISVGLDAQGGVFSTPFTLNTAHKNRLLICTNGITITLPTINTMKSGDLFYITNIGIEPITLALNGNSTSLNTLKVIKGETLVIQSDGGSFYRGVARNTTPIYDFDANLVVPLAYNTVYQADVDLTLIVLCSGSYMNGIEIVIGTTTSPTRVVSRTGDDINSNTKHATLTAVITAGLYFKVQGFGEQAFEAIEITAYKHK